MSRSWSLHSMVKRRSHNLNYCILSYSKKKLSFSLKCRATEREKHRHAQTTHSQCRTWGKSSFHQLTPLVTLTARSGTSKSQNTRTVSLPTHGWLELQNLAYLLKIFSGSLARKWSWSRIVRVSIRPAIGDAGVVSGRLTSCDIMAFQLLCSLNESTNNNVCKILTWYPSII